MTTAIGSQRLYQSLDRVLDSIRQEAPKSNKAYWPVAGNQSGLVQAKSRALLHLFLKARFGLTEFEEREHFVTDGAHDGGIDAYFIDRRNKVRYVLQAKYRASADNFKASNVSAEELLKMDVAAILSGKQKSDAGEQYNERIRLHLQRDLKKISDIGSYKTKVVLIGNFRTLAPHQIKKLVDGNDFETFGYERSYRELLFPVISGTFFSDPDLTVDIQLSNLRGGTTHLDYDAKVEGAKANIKLIFVPTREIGRIMSKYRNSLLQFNPRSFLELASNQVNQAIAASIENVSTNEFSLFNNGITIISQQTSFSTDTGKSGAAQLVLHKPHLVNGGQTAYTLSRVYDKCSRKGSFDVFRNKEVLVKVITLKDLTSKHDEWIEMVGQISKASNSQTKVDEADRRSNDPVQVELQMEFFEKYGLYYERKRGEFADGLREEYIAANQLVNREKLLRAVLASEFMIREARSSIRPYFEENALADLLRVSRAAKYVYGYEALRVLESRRRKKPKVKKDRYHTSEFGQALRYGIYAVVAACVKLGVSKRLPEQDAVDSVLKQWRAFEDWAAKRSKNKPYVDKNGSFDFLNYYKGSTINVDATVYSFKNV